MNHIFLANRRSQAASLASLTCVALTVSTLLSGPARADDPPPSNSSLEGLQVRAGATGNTLGAPDWGFYHKVTYKDQMLTAHGNPIKNSDATHQLLQKKGGTLTDASKVSFDLVDGSGAVDDGTLNALGIQSIPVKKLGVDTLRTTLRFASTLNGAHKVAVAGFETKGMHIPGLDLSHWVILGINGGYEGQPKSAGGETGTGQLTGRAFFGDARWRYMGKGPFDKTDAQKALDVSRIGPDTPRADGKVHYQDRLIRYANGETHSDNNDLDHFLIVQAGKFAPGPGDITSLSLFEETLKSLIETANLAGNMLDFEAAKAALAPSVIGNDPIDSEGLIHYQMRLKRYKDGSVHSQNAALDLFLKNLADKYGQPPVVLPKPGDFLIEADFNTWLSRTITIALPSYTLQPKYAAWLETEGWYNFAGKTSGQRARGIVAPTVTYYFALNGKSRSDIQVRYETGFDYAAPTTRVNRVIATLGLDF